MIQTTKFFLPLLLLSGIYFITAFGCSESNSSPRTSAEVSYDLVMNDSLVIPFPYKLSSPDAEIQLPAYLKEVSALSFVDGNRLAMVHDESGIIYQYDLVAGELTDKIMIKRKGDFEGIEVVGNTAYMLRSDGVIYEVINYTSESPVVNKHETSLSGSDDTEGLGYEPTTHSLLVACKEPGRIQGKRLKQHRIILAFDLETKELRKRPYALVDLKEALAYLKAHANEDKQWEKLTDSFDPSSKGSFKPSGVAIHPITGYTYIIASNGQLMIVLNKEHKIAQIQPLPRKVFSQPEGICFSPSGELFISNEGRNRAGNILRFAYQPAQK